MARVGMLTIHALPVTLGGTDDIANLVPACASCNGKKGVKTMVQFIGNGGYNAS